MLDAEAIRSRGRIWRYALLIILAAALLLRLWGMGFGLPQKVHPDEPLLADRAIEAVSNGNFNPGFYHWPSFVIYLLCFEYFALFLIGWVFGVFSGIGDIFQSYFADPTLYFWIGRLTTALFCIGGMSCLYLLGKKIGGRGAGLAAAVLMGFNAIFVEHSRYITPDIPAACLMIYVWYCLLDYLESGRLRMLYAAAFVGGVAVSTKYNTALLLVPILIAAVSRVQHWPEGDVPRTSRRIGVYLLICLLLFVLGFFLFTPYSLLDSVVFWRQLSDQFAHQRIGHIGMESGGGALFAVAAHFFSPYGLVILALTLGGIPLLSKPATRGLILLSFPLLYLISIAGWVVWAERYMLFILPTCFLAAGVSLAYLGKLIAPKRKELAAILLACLVTLPSFVSAARHASVISRPDTRVVALRWIEENIPPRSRLFIDKGGPEPHHVDDIGIYGLNVSPVYYYPEQKLWLSIENVEMEPLMRLRRLAPSPQYIITSSYTRDRYFDPATQANHPELVKPWLKYYGFVETYCELVYPDEDYPKDEYTGPLIRIYRLPPDALK